jgi:hypothetical protein
LQEDRHRPCVNAAEDIQAHIGVCPHSVICYGRRRASGDASVDLNAVVLDGPNDFGGYALAVQATLLHRLKQFIYAYSTDDSRTSPRRNSEWHLDMFREEVFSVRRRFAAGVPAGSAAPACVQATALAALGQAASSVVYMDSFGSAS